MMPTSYRGRSNFFDSPAGKALTQLSSAPLQAPAGGAMPGMFDTMRPSLRNTIADRAGEEMLRSIERRQPWVSHDEGNPDMPGVFGQPRDFYVDPAVADRESARQSDFMRTMQEFDLGDELEDTAARRGAGREADIADFDMRRDVKRYYDPLNASMRADEQRYKYRLATDPARFAADNRADVARVESEARVRAAEAAANARMGQAGMDLLPELTKSGVFGRDRRGNPMPPSPEVANQALETVRRILSSGGRGGGAGMAGMMGAPGGGQPGGTPGGAPGIPPEIQAQMQPYIAAGYSPEEVLAHFQKTGRIR